MVSICVYQETKMVINKGLNKRLQCTLSQKTAHVYEIKMDENNLT